MSFYLTGKIMLCGGVMILPSAIVSLIYSDGQILPLLATAAAFFVIGLAGIAQKPKKRDFFAKEGLLIVGTTWILFSAVGALPFWISGQIPNYIDAFFETVSGFTTTGSTILTDVESMSMSLLFWRSFTHWVGGIGVLVFAMAVLSQKDMRATFILRAEMPGLKTGKFAAKWRHSMQILIAIYVVLSFAEFVLLLAGGMNVFDSMVHTFGTAGTGGFGVKNSSIGYYNSAYIDYVIGIFMLMFGVNFNIYYLLLTKKFSLIRKNEELWAYAAIVAVSVICIALNIMPLCGSFGESFRQSFFQVSSIITTTGYATADFNLWPTFSKIILVLLMFIGACAGSTGGGLKVIRTVILSKTALMSIKKAFFPRRVQSYKSEGKPLDNELASGVCSYFAVYMLIMAVSVIIVSLDGFDMSTTVTSVIATFNNIGPGLEMVGPAGNFSQFSYLSKLVLSFDMLAGRLELYPLMIFMVLPAIRKKMI